MAKRSWLALPCAFLASFAFAAFALPYSNPHPPLITVVRIGPDFNVSGGDNSPGSGSRPSQPVKLEERVPGPTDCFHDNLTYGPTGSLSTYSTSAEEGYWRLHEACGPFRFEPDPEPNRVMTLNVNVTPAMPHVGEAVTFRIDASDQDAQISRQCPTVSYGKNIGGQACGISQNQCEAYYGTWKPPDPALEDRYLFEFRYAYLEPGAYTATFDIHSGSGYKPLCGFQNPFSDIVRAAVELVVLP